jgi:hypothetical protein
VKRRKFLLGSSALLTSGAFMTGTGAFSSTELDRGLDVAVASDKVAYLALTTDEDGNPTAVGLISAEGPFEVPQPITVGNQLNQRITVSIESDEDITFNGSDSVTFDLGVGEEQEVVIDLTENESIEADIEITAQGDGVHIEATRKVKLEPQFEIHNVIFRGAGGVDINATATAPFELVYWVAAEVESGGSGQSGNGNGNGGGNTNGGGLSPGKITAFDEFGVAEFGPSGKLRGNDGGPGYVAVYFPQSDTSYYHPEFDPTAHEIDNWGQGQLSGLATGGKIL